MDSKTAERIRAKCTELGEFLAAKNESYGDSALHPVGIFASGEAEELIRVRLDDKLSRLRHAPGSFGEDEVWDMLGYLVLLLLAREDKQRMKGRTRTRAWRREAMPGAAGRERRLAEGHRGGARHGRAGQGA